MRGKSIDRPHPVIVLFDDLDRMNWSHLPVSGGLDKQDPGLMDLFRIIWREQGKADAEESKKQEAEAKQVKRRSPRGGR